MRRRGPDLIGGARNAVAAVAAGVVLLTTFGSASGAPTGTDAVTRAVSGSASVVSVPNDLLNGSGSFENGTLDPPITLYGGSWSQALDGAHAHDGTHSARIARVTSAPGNGYVYIPLTFSQGITYEASVWLLGDSTSNGKPYNLAFRFPDGTRATSTSVNAANGSWVRLTLTGTAPTSGSGNLYITDDPQAAPAHPQTIWLDQIVITPSPDALWVQSSSSDSALGGLSVCKDPTSSASIAQCFGAGSAVNTEVGSTWAPTIAGSNLYIGAWSCPIYDYGLNCTRIQMPDLTGTNSQVAVAAVGLVGGTLILWVGIDESNGASLQRCPVVPYDPNATTPLDCVEIDSYWAGNGNFNQFGKQMIYTNDRLYVPISGNAIWSCDPWIGDCVRGGVSGAAAMSVGGGYLWVGSMDTDPATLTRCDLSDVTNCQLWESFPGELGSAPSVADDGQGNMWVANHQYGLFTHPSDGIYKCPMATPAASGKQNCTQVISNVWGWRVTAGNGLGFSSVNNGAKYPPIAWNATQYPQSIAATSSSKSTFPEILYIPVGGPTVIGQARVRAPLRGKHVEALARRCDEHRRVPADLTVSGPYRIKIHREVDLCRLRSQFNRAPRGRFGGLNKGRYRVEVRVGGYQGTARFTIRTGAPTPVTLRIAKR